MRRRVDEECDDDDENENDDDGMDGAGDAMDDLDYDFLSYELEYLSVYGYQRSVETIANDDDDGDGDGGTMLPSSSSPSSSPEEYDLHNDLLIEHSQHLSSHVRQLRRDDDDDDDDYVVFVDRAIGPRPRQEQAANRNSYTSFLQVPLHELSEDDVVYALRVPGGKSELVRVLLDGAHARESLMRGKVQLFRRRSAADIGIVLSGGTNRDDDDDVVAVPSSGCRRVPRREEGDVRDAPSSRRGMRRR